MNTEMITDMNTERNYQTKAIYKKGNLLCMIRITKISSLTYGNS